MPRSRHTDGGQARHTGFAIPATHIFVSQQPALSAEYRNRYLRGEWSAEEFAQAVLAPFTPAPTAPPGLLQPGASYLPSSQVMQPKIVARFRGLAQDLIDRSTEGTEARRRCMEAVEALFAQIESALLPGRSPHVITRPCPVAASKVREK